MKRLADGSITMFEGTLPPIIKYGGLQFFPAEPYPKWEFTQVEIGAEVISECEFLPSSEQSQTKKPPPLPKE